MTLLDTGLLYALIDADDANHVRVREVVERERGRRLFDSVVTTNYALAEVLTLLRTRGKQDLRSRHARAVEVGRQLYAGAFGRLHQVSPEEEHAGFEYFARHADKVGFRLRVLRPGQPRRCLRVDGEAKAAEPRRTLSHGQREVGGGPSP